MFESIVQALNSIASKLTSPYPTTSWISWTPTFVCSSAGTMGNSVCVGSYIQQGKTVKGWAKFTLGNTANWGGTAAILLTLPVPAAGAMTAAVAPIGNVVFKDANGSYYVGVLSLSSTTLGVVWAEVANGTHLFPADVTGAIPFTWAATDWCTVSFQYEAA